MSEEYYSTTFCVECGPDVKVDEDGCCASCGGAAIGPYAEKYGELKAEVDRLREVYRAARGLCFGQDWNKGTHATKHGYRHRLILAVDAVEPLPPGATVLDETHEP